MAKKKMTQSEIFGIADRTRDESQDLQRITKSIESLNAEMFDDDGYKIATTLLTISRNASDAAHAVLFHQAWSDQQRELNR